MFIFYCLSTEKSPESHQQNYWSRLVYVWGGVLVFLFLCFHSWANKMEALTSKSAADPEGYLAHPVNAYKLVKRLNTDWPALEDLVLQNSAAGEDW